jgi:ABC-type dipeptide/oligopeptide/nickel transport system permease subunit
MNRTLGLVLLAVGLVILGFGINASMSLTDQVVEGVSGRYSNTTMWYILGGLAMVVAGGSMALLCNKCDKK